MTSSPLVSELTLNRKHKVIVMGFLLLNVTYILKPGERKIFVFGDDLLVYCFNNAKLRTIQIFLCCGDFAFFRLINAL